MIDPDKFPAVAQRITGIRFSLPWEARKPAKRMTTSLETGIHILLKVMREKTARYPHWVMKVSMALVKASKKR